MSSAPVHRDAWRSARTRMIALSRTSSSELLAHVAYLGRHVGEFGDRCPIGMGFRRLHEGQRGQRVLRQSFIPDEPGGPRLDGAQEPDERVLAPLPYHSRVYALTPRSVGVVDWAGRLAQVHSHQRLRWRVYSSKSALSTGFAAPHEPPVSERRQVGLENIHNKPPSTVEAFGLPRASV